MKVFQINSVCGYGSTGKIAVDLAHTITAAGGQCRIAYGRGTAPDGIDCVKITGELDVRLHGILSRITDKSGFYSKKATLRLIDQIKAFDPDIIHLHNIHGYYLNVKLLFGFLKEYKRPVVWTLHDCWAFTGHCAHFSAVGCDKWITQCKSCPQKKEYPSSLLLDNSENNYCQKKSLFTSLQKLYLVTPSYWLKDTVKESFFAKYPVHVIYNGIDLNVFHHVDSDFKLQYNMSDKKMVLGVANTWSPHKGLNDFIALSRLLPPEYKIVLVGLSKKQITQLPSDIIGIPRTENISELVKLYSAADIYVNTSVEETMGLSTVEALACGTPAVVYDATAVPEVVDKTCGTVVPAGNVEALFEAVCLANYDPQDCICRAQCFEKDKQYSQYMALYSQIIK